MVRGAMPKSPSSTPTADVRGLPILRGVAVGGTALALAGCAAPSGGDNAAPVRDTADSAAAGGCMMRTVQPTLSDLAALIPAQAPAAQQARKNQRTGAAPDAAIDTLLKAYQARAPQPLTVALFDLRSAAFDGCVGASAPDVRAACEQDRLLPNGPRLLFGCEAGACSTKAAVLFSPSGAIWALATNDLFPQDGRASAPSLAAPASGSAATVFVTPEGRTQDQHAVLGPFAAWVRATTSVRTPDASATHPKLEVCPL